MTCTTYLDKDCFICFMTVKIRSSWQGYSIIKVRGNICVSKVVLEMSKLFAILLIYFRVFVTNSQDPGAASSRARLALNSCDFVDLSVVGAICGAGKKIKYFKVIQNNSVFAIFAWLKEKTKPRPKHTIFWDGISGHTILAVHSGPQWDCCSSSERKYSDYYCQ